MKNYQICCVALLFINTAFIPKINNKRTINLSLNNMGTKPGKIADSVPDDHTISEGEAGDMVTAFRTATGYYHRKTTTWFSRAYIDALYTATHQGKFDGIRVYLGMRNQRHTFLIVPTSDYGIYRRGGNESITIHKDNFQGILPGYRFAVQTGEDEDKDEPGATLDDKNACPIDKNVAYGLYSEHAVSCADARSWVKHKTIINGVPADRVNTYSEWFEKKFICELHNDLNAKAATGESKDGVRIYLARQHRSKRRPGSRHVFLWVSTYGKSDGKGKTVHMDDYLPLEKRTIIDNGMQCLNNCHGATLQ